MDANTNNHGAAATKCHQCSEAINTSSNIDNSAISNYLAPPDQVKAYCCYECLALNVRHAQEEIDHCRQYGYQYFQLNPGDLSKKLCDISNFHAAKGNVVCHFGQDTDVKICRTTTGSMYCTSEEGPKRIQLHFKPSTSNSEIPLLVQEILLTQSGLTNHFLVQGIKNKQYDAFMDEFFAGATARIWSIMNSVVCPYAPFEHWRPLRSPNHYRTWWFLPSAYVESIPLQSFTINSGSIAIEIHYGTGVYQTIIVQTIE
ncbi:hypothetical protein SEMRO_2410_G326680.1 [Seminavis robusta]|uniref:Uncharacterized protein n=1 Tax=Seminavis robusta TaxID=568900 RepID=A0A9N8F0U7_9STRA|nr:hypothetical protein SEMRO_2410_G326680.1 [Seminavis robusta]|eukprot:Sro2410_g326680.1 n/a (258) ;mRNA; r:7626-8399